MNGRTVIVCYNLIDLFDALPLHPELRARLDACFADDPAAPVPPDNVMAGSLMTALHEAYSVLPAHAAALLTGVCTALAQRARRDIEAPIGTRRVML